MAILALTQFSHFIGLPSALGCAALIVYLLAAPAPRDEGPARVAISRVFVFASMAFAAIWFWLSAALPLIAWLTVLGDRNHWFYDHSSKVAALVALLVSVAAFLRATLGSASKRYVSALAWTPPVLLVTAAIFALEHTLSPVEGLTAESAAQSILEDNVPNTTITMKLQAQAGPATFRAYVAERKDVLDRGGPRESRADCREAQSRVGLATLAQPQVSRLDRYLDGRPNSRAAGRGRQGPLLPAASCQFSSRHSGWGGGSSPAGRDGRTGGPTAS